MSIKRAGKEGRFSEAPTLFAEPEAAIQDLLETLLAEVPSADSEDATEGLNTQVPPDGQVVENAALSLATSTAEVLLEEPRLNHPETPPITISDQSLPANTQDDEAIGPPAWLEGDLTVLIVKIAGQRLGLPLVRLNGIARVDQFAQATRLPGQPTWHLGVLEYRGEKLVLVDLASYWQLSAQQTSPVYLLACGEDRFGLLCDAIDEPLRLSADAVDWRRSDAAQPWKLGTLREALCPLVDPARLAKALQGDLD